MSRTGSCIRDHHIDCAGAVGWVSDDEDLPMPKCDCPCHNYPEADLSLALDLLEKHQGDCWTDSCLSCSGVDGFHELDCALAQLLERHGREVRWAE